MDNFLSFRDDQTSTEEAVSLEAFLGQSNANVVRIEPGEDARALLPHIDRIARVEISFPAYTDGRGYSSAQILREQGYVAELRACGDVLVDQLPYMRRCGFDSFASDAPLDPKVVKSSLERYDDQYQKTVDGRQPIWAKRHG